MRETGGNPFLVRAVAEEMGENGYDPLTAPWSLVRRDVLIADWGLADVQLLVISPTSPQSSATTPHSMTAVRLSGLTPEQGLSSAEELVTAGILISAEPIRFAHRRVQRAIYRLLATSRTTLTFTARQRNCSSARRRDRKSSADHLLEAGPTHEQWASAILHRAGREASGRGATATAVRYLRRAVDVAYPVEPSARILIDLGLAEAAAGEPMSLEPI